jgi:hypothetical protein
MSRPNQRRAEIGPEGAHLSAQISENFKFGKGSFGRRDFGSKGKSGWAKKRLDNTSSSSFPSGNPAKRIGIFPANHR